MMALSLDVKLRIFTHILLDEGFTPMEIYLATRLDAMVKRDSLIASGRGEDEMAKVDADFDRLFSEHQARCRI